VLFRGDDPALGVYVIHSGEVDLVGSLPGRMPRTIRRAGPGELLSVSQVVAGRPHDATAIAATTARIGFVKRDDFLATLDANPGAWPAVLQLLSQQIHSMYDAMKAPA
jgi:CRP-like cAMP-binding protein